MARFIFIVTGLILTHLIQIKGQGISVGLVAGSNLSTLNIDHAEYGYGYQFGGFYNFGVSERVGLQSEILYSFQQADVMNRSVKVRSVLIPVLLDLSLNSILSLQVGPQFNVLSVEDHNGESIEYTQGQNAMSFALGLGVDVPGRIGLNLRFANAIDDGFSRIGEATSDMVQFSLVIDLVRLDREP